MEEDISEAALTTAYQVSSRYFVNEEQLIWRRTSFFVTLQSFAAAMVYYFRSDLHSSLLIVFPIIGLFYSVCWHFSMKRAWAYQKFIIRVMREQEEALKLGKENTSPISKMPYKLLCLRALYQIRICDLGQASHLLYTKKAYLPAFVLTRAVMETVAMLYVFFLKGSEAVKKNDIYNIDDFLMKALLGTRDGTGSVKHYNALTSIQHVGKRNAEFEKLYLGLCEFAHPNWGGVSLAYGEQIDEGQMVIKTIRDAPFADTIGMKPLIASLMLFDEIYHGIEELISKFTEVCENC